VQDSPAVLEQPEDDAEGSDPEEDYASSEFLEAEKSRNRNKKKWQRPKSVTHPPASACPLEPSPEDSVDW
jgi:hypothetical protein